MFHFDVQRDPQHAALSVYGRFYSKDNRGRHRADRPPKSDDSPHAYAAGEYDYKRIAIEEAKRTRVVKLLNQFPKEGLNPHSASLFQTHWTTLTEQESSRALLYFLVGASATSQSDLAAIHRSKSQEELLDVLDQAGFERQVESFRQHVLDRQDYVEEGGHPDAQLESLKAAAQFLVKYNPPYSDIEADFEGKIEFEWMLSPKVVEPDIDQEFWDDGSGYMAIRFVSSKAIEFAMLSGPRAKDRERLKVSGIFSHSKMNTIVKMFKDRMVMYD